MPRTYLIHTDKANEEKVKTYVGCQKEIHGELDALVETASADTAANIGNADPALFEAVVSSALPKCQEIASGYKELGVRCTMIGADDPEHIKKVKAQQAEDEKAAKKSKG